MQFLGQFRKAAIFSSIFHAQIRRPCLLVSLYSWGPEWGDNGYGRIARGVNQCGIEQFPHLPTLREVESSEISRGCFMYTYAELTAVDEASCRNRCDQERSLCDDYRFDSSVQQEDPQVIVQGRNCFLFLSDCSKQAYSPKHEADKDLLSLVRDGVGANLRLTYYADSNDVERKCTTLLPGSWFRSSLGDILLITLPVNGRMFFLNSYNKVCNGKVEPSDSLRRDFVAER